MELLSSHFLGMATAIIESSYICITERKKVWRAFLFWSQSSKIREALYEFQKYWMSLQTPYE